MRVDPNTTPGMLSALQRVTASQNTALSQLASGKKIQLPSDDPAAMASLIGAHSANSANSQFLTAIKLVSIHVQVADSDLNSVSTGLERAIALGVRGATGTMTDTDRNAIAAEIDGIRDQLLESANSSVEGIYLFSGTAATTRPFIQSNGSVNYAGSQSSNQVAIGESLTVTTDLPGTQLFGDDPSGVFASLQQLSAALRSNNAIPDPITALRAARDQFASARVVYGNTLTQLNNSQLALQQRGVQLAQQETEIAGADLAEVVTRLTSSETARNALLAALGKTNSGNLFDYLR